MGHDLTYRLVIRLARGLLRLLGLRVRVTGAEHVPRTGGAVLASNHVGFLDFLFVGLVGTGRGRLVRFLAKEGVFRTPVAGSAMRAMGHVPVDRAHGEVALRRAVETVRAGEVVGVFPEATISHSWQLRPLRPGAAAAVVWTGAPLVPVVVWGSQRVLTVGGRWSLRRGRLVTVDVGEPLRPGPAADPHDVTAALRDRLDTMLSEAVARYPDVPHDDADRWWLPDWHGGTAPGAEEGLRLDEEGMVRADAALARAQARRRPRPQRSRRQ